MVIGGIACGLTKRWVFDQVGKSAVNLAYLSISGVAAQCLRIRVLMKKAKGIRKPRLMALVGKPEK